MLAVDGTEPQELRKMMELELDNQQSTKNTFRRFSNSAGGFAPTVGIIGAVLGLIQVMQHLDKIDEVGEELLSRSWQPSTEWESANLLYLPIAGKNETPHSGAANSCGKMTLEGVASILEGMNPHHAGDEIGLASWWRRIRTRSAPRRPADETPQTHPRPLQPRALAGFLCGFSSLCCSHFLSSYMPPRRSIRERSANWPWAIQVAFQEMGVFRLHDEDPAGSQ